MYETNRQETWEEFLDRYYKEHPEMVEIMSEYRKALAVYTESINAGKPKFILVTTKSTQKVKHSIL